MKQFLKSHFPILFLIAISGILCVANYIPGTFLSGWDTLHPEFNFGLNFSRVFYGVFRSEQGLGAVAGHSHMVEIVRIILLYILHFFAPINFLRYGYIFLCLIIGPIGIYYFLYRCVTKDMKTSLLGALFYLLNLGTLQIFVVPFEMFTTQYALLPWIFLFATEYLDKGKGVRGKGKEKFLLIFSLVTIFAAPIAYAATLWYVQFLVFCIFVFVFSLVKNFTLHPKPFPLLKRPFVLILLTLLLNLYWILPNIYFVAHHANEVTNANINKLFSEEAFLHNKEFGNVQNIALLKTFYFDWNVYTGNNNFDSLLAPWISYLHNPYIIGLGYAFTAIALLGIAYALKKKNAVGISILPVLLVCWFFLFNDNGAQSPIYEFLQQYIPFFKEALRFPGDKILGIYILVFTVYFTFGQLFIFSTLIKIVSFLNPKHEINPSASVYGNDASIVRGLRLTADSKRYGLRNRLTKDKRFLFEFRILIKSIYISIFSLLFILYMFPAFQGQLISPYMRITIPNEYFQMNDWFNRQSDSGRVATLPINSLWGWAYYDWYGAQQPSYQGAGFVWFGMKQPVLDRDFDRWSPYNEQYYREMSYAVYSQDPSALMQVLRKYDIHYLLLDTSITAPESDKTALQFEQIKTMLAGQKDITQSAQFSDHIVVYHVGNQQKSPIRVVSGTLPHISQASIIPDIDRAFSMHNDYVLDNTSAALTYPYQIPLTNENNLTDDNIQQTNNAVTITTTKAITIFPKDIKTYSKYETRVPADMTAQVQKNSLQLTFTPKILNHPLRSVTAQVQLLPTDTTIAISINHTNTYTIPIETNYPIVIKDIPLNTQKDTTINFYHPAKQEIAPTITGSNFSIISCGQFPRSQSFGLNPIGSNGFSLVVNHTQECAFIPMNQIAPASQLSLIHLSFNYHGNSPLYVCLVNNTNGDCLDDTQKQVTASSHIDNLWELDPSEIGHDYIKLYTDSQQKNETISFTDFFSDQSQSFSTTQISAGAMQDIFAENPPITTNTLNFTTQGSNGISGLIPSRTNDCVSNIFGSSQPTSQADMIKNTTNQYIEYSTATGIFCDHFSYTNAHHDQAYIAAITAKNISGLPLHICIANRSSSHCDVTAVLPHNKDFATQYFLIPALYDQAEGYDIDVSNIGIDGTPGKNAVSAISLTPIPYNWLSSLENSSASNAQGYGTMNSSMQELNPDYYLASIPDNTVHQATIILSESFEPGWHAYQLNNQCQISNVKYQMYNIPCFFEQAFPFLFGKEIKQHVLVNGWENGWETNGGIQKVAILFLPQYLEFAGFSIVFITFIALLFMSFRAEPQ